MPTDPLLHALGTNICLSRDSSATGLDSGVEQSMKEKDCDRVISRCLTSLPVAESGAGLREGWSAELSLGLAGLSKGEPMSGWPPFVTRHNK